MTLNPIDSDNHLCEPDDCFTRHIESKYADRALHIRRDASGKRRWYCGGQPIVFLPEAIDRTLQPGALQVKYRSAETRKLRYFSRAKPASGAPRISLRHGLDRRLQTLHTPSTSLSVNFALPMRSWISAVIEGLQS